MLRVIDHVPEGLLELEAPALADALGAPTLIRLPGRRPRPLLAAVLVHGNETTGWDAVRSLLAGAAPLPRALMLFIGNVHAARECLRRLDGQPDFNRIWRGTAGAEGEMVRGLLAEAQRARPFACVDLHNTSGENPLYACVHRLDDASLALGRAFSERLVLVSHPDTLLSNALSHLAPSVTLECGKPGNPSVTRRLARFLAQVLALETLDAHHPSTGPRGFEVLRAVATVRVPEELSFSFHDEAADLRFVAGLDAHNFSLLPDGTPIAFVRPGSGGRLEATDETGRDVTDRYFRHADGVVVTAAPLIPSLLTPNERIIRQDCLCYVMEPLGP
jgi:hypothetical protein